MALSLATLLVRESAASIYKTALGVAESLGLPVSSWQPGDPTRSLYHLEAKLFETLEELAAGFISSGFLDYAEGAWLKILAEQVFGVTAQEATFATTSVVLTNSSKRLYVLDPGDLTFKSSANGKTYRSTTGGTLAAGPGSTLTVSVVADEAGSDSSASAGDIDELVTTLLGVTCTNPTAAIGVDEQSAASLRQQCRDKLGSLSPNGPREAYAYVARNSALTGTPNVTRTRVYSESDTGDVTLYVASASGAVTEPDRALVEAAILKWATPLCITPTVLSAESVTVNVTYTLWVYKSVNKTAAEVQADVQKALQSMFASRPIGGDIVPPSATGALYRSMIESTIRAVYPQAFRVSLSLPSSDVALTNGQVPALGTATGTIHLVVDP